MDGTLVDTEPMWMDAEHALAAEYGATWTHEDGIALVGSGLLDAGVYIREKMGVPLTAEQIVDRLVDSVTDSLRASVPWRPGARELLQSLHDAGVPMALVTMSYRVQADIIAEAAGVFDAVVAGDEVTRPKPFPDPYHQGATAIGVAVDRCVAFEDSPTGVRSAVDAGCTTVVVQGHADVDPTLGHLRVSGLENMTVDRIRSLVADTVDV